MRNARLIVSLVLLALLALGSTLFVLQNLGRTTDLSLDLHLIAWHLANPLPVVYLLLGSVLGGLLVGAGVGYFMGRRQRTSSLSSSGASLETDDAWT